MAVMRRPVPPHIPGVVRPEEVDGAAAPARPRHIRRRAVAAGIGAVALLPLGGVVAAALTGTSRGPVAETTTPVAPASSAAVTAQAAPTPDPPMFSDVDDTRGDRDAIEWAADAGLLSGDDAGAFHPDDAVTRSALALVLHRYAGAPDVPLDSPVFTDMPDGEDGAAVQWAGVRGILWGDEDLAVRPGGALTRGDLAASLMAAFSGGLTAAGIGVDVAEATAFEDVDASDAATLPLRWAAAAGALTRSRTAADGTPLASAMGPGATVLVPERAATRGELAVAVYAMQELLS